MDRTVRSEVTFLQCDFSDRRSSDSRITFADKRLNQFLSASVVHPCDCCMGCEVVISRVESLLDGFAFDGLVESSHFGCSITHTEPEHADILHRGKDTQTAVFGLKRFDSRFHDGGRKGRFEFGKSFFADLAKEFEGDVDLFGVGESKSLGLCELGLEIGDSLRELVGEIDTGEQSHSECSLGVS